MKQAFLDAVLTLLAGMVVTIAVFGLGPLIETRYFPVYTKMQIVSIERIPPNNSLITAKYEKLRDCEPLASAWYNSPIAVDLDARQLQFTPRRAVGGNPGPRPLNRPIGKYTSQPFELDASPEDIKQTVFAEVFSRCHPFWTTRTLIYP